MVTKHSVKQFMKLENDKWKTTFNVPQAQICCGRLGLFFEFTIDVNPSSLILMKTESKHLIEDMRNLWENKTLSDVTFKCKEKSIEAHTVIITARSPVMAAMFQHDFKENKEKVVEVTDIKPNVFEQLLLYIYTGDAELEKVDVAELLVAADKYEIESLKEECSFRLSQEISVENASRLLVFSHLHNSPKLHESILDFMSKNAKTVCSSMDWMVLMKNYPDLCFKATQFILGL